MKNKILFLLIAVTFCQATYGQSPYSYMNDETKTLCAVTENEPVVNIVGLLTDGSKVVAKFNFKDCSIEYADDFGRILCTDTIPINRKAFTSMDPRAGEMPWVSPYVYCFGNPINLVDPTGEYPSEYEAALMADIVYVKNLTNDRLPEDLVKSGWTLSTFNTSITMNMTDWYQNGLQSALFERTIDGVTEYAYVFAGSNSVEDYLEDFAQLFGNAPQYDSAIQNAETLSTELRPSELTFVGHSLGGGEAAASSMATGRSAITFNAAAVSPSTIRAHNLGNADNVINYRMAAPGNGSIRIGGCFVSNFQNNIGMGAAGKQVRIIAPNHNPYTAHRISNFVNYFRNK